MIIPVFNSEKTIKRCLKSVQECGHSNIEILVYDDCSKDKSLDLVSEIAHQDERIRVLRGSENNGAGHARNELLKIAKGDYYAFLDSDDYWYPGKLHQQIEVAVRGNYDIVTSGYDISDEEGNLIGQRIPVQNITKTKMLLTNWLPTSMTVVNSYLRNANQMPNLRKRQDYTYWLHLYQNNNIICHTIQSPLGMYMRRTQSVSTGKLSNVKANYMMFRTELSYSWMFSSILVFMNIIIRVLRK